MSNFNQVTLLGRLGADPEIRTTPNGQTVANLRLATSEKWKTKEGEAKERTEWHTVTAFGRQAEVIGEYVRKGHLLLVQGRLQTDKWKDREGVDRYTTKVIVTSMTLMPNKQNSEADATNTEGTAARTTRASRGARAAVAAASSPEPENDGSANAPDSFDDDIPF